MRRGAPIVVAAALVAVALTACAPAADEPGRAAAPAPVPSASAPSPAAEPAEPAARPAVLGEGIEPARVAIPRIGLDEPLVRLGILDDGTMGVPADWDAVGWFTGGGRPGGRGPTVIAGHVDSGTAPAVFFRLEELAPGDEIAVTDVDGGAHAYRVTSVEDAPKADFPTARVFGAVPRDELRLVTCSGFFDPEAAAYEDNRIVFAERVG